MRVAIIGATGATGRMLTKLLHERDFPLDELVLFASDNSVGQKLSFGDQVLEAHGLGSRASRNFDLAFCAAENDVSKLWVNRFNDAGACVIDLAAYRRMYPEVPLVIPEVNAQMLTSHDGIIANPNCATIQLLVALKPIYDAVGITRIVVSSLQSVSGAGEGAVEELNGQVYDVLEGRVIDEPKRLPHRIAFNCFPNVGGFYSPEWNDEEKKIMEETKKILGDADIGVSPTCGRIPVKVGHSQDVTIETERPLETDRCRKLLEAAPGVVVQDAPKESLYPMPMNVIDSDEVFVGRIRDDPSRKNAKKLWIVANNLRKGGATNAVQIAELLDQQELIHP